MRRRANVGKMWVKAPSKWTEAKCKDKSNFEITFGKHRDGTEEDLLKALSSIAYISHGLEAH